MNEWTLICRVEAMSIGFYEYINKDHTLCMQVWDDGYVEYYEPA